MVMCAINVHVISQKWLITRAKWSASSSYHRHINYCNFEKMITGKSIPKTLKSPWSYTELQHITAAKSRSPKPHMLQTQKLFHDVSGSRCVEMSTLQLDKYTNQKSTVT
jgi:hypothetical protein